MDHETLIDQFCALHHESDPDTRQQILAAITTEDVAFHAIQGDAFGREAMDRFYHTDGSLVRTTPVEERRGWIRCGWEYHKPDGTVPILDGGQPYAGQLVAHVADDGKIDVAIPFLGFGPQP